MTGRPEADLHARPQVPVEPEQPVLLDASRLRSWAAGARSNLQARCADLDALNVFPVADSDTGTNLCLTLAGTAAAVDAVPAAAPASTVGAAMARGALLGARGNSGVIVGQYLGAFVRSLTGDGTPDGTLDGGAEAEPGDDAVVRSLVFALGTAADAAYAAVGEPVEGTVLTVARAVADAAGARGAVPGADRLSVLEGAVEDGYAALQRTTSQLPALRAAGVLDAGAWGLLLVLDALAECLGSTRAAARAGAELTAPPAEDRLPTSTGPAPDGRDCHGGGEFEVMYLVEADEPGQDRAPWLRAALAGVGGSVAVVGGGDLWQVHVHTDQPLAAVAVGRSASGRTSQVRVRHLPSQEGVHGSHRPAVGVVAVTTAPGLVADLARAGAVVVLAAGVQVGPEVDRAVDDTGAPEVLVLSAVGLDRAPSRATVLDGLSEVQVVTGVATYASGRATAAPGGPLAGEIARSVRSVRTAAVDEPAGDVGGPSHAELVTAAVTDLLAPDGVLLTAVLPDGPAAAVLAEVVAVLAGTHPDVEVLALRGGGTGPILLGVE